MLLYNPDLILNEVQSHFTDEIEPNKEGLLKIVQSLATLHQAVADSKSSLEPWETYIGTLIQKMITCALSLIKLSEGYNLNILDKEKNIHIVDSPSMVILTRSILECYLTMYHIYFVDLPKDHKHFRFKLWEVSGIISRSKFEGEQDGLKEKKESEKLIIDRKLAELKADIHYISLTKDHKRKLNDFGLPRLESFNKLIKNSNLKGSQFGNMYSFYSSYTHSEYLSLLQMKQGNLNIADLDNKRMAVLSLIQAHMINSVTIYLLQKRFIGAQLIYNAFPTITQSAIKMSAEMAIGRNKTQNKS